MQNMYIVPSKLFKESLKAIILKSRKKMDSNSRAERGLSLDVIQRPNSEKIADELTMQS